MVLVIRASTVRSVVEVGFEVWVHILLAYGVLIRGPKRGSRFQKYQNQLHNCFSSIKQYLN